ncbi:DUF6766 family protein [Nonomuraea sp. NPDC050404]|uniref:DUF6766 family protein n=1 Tax=Nonomuraea sp. NPDC050404 TaxID=3155783 RepID=UPI0033F2CA37
MRMPIAVLALALTTVGCSVDTAAPARAAERFHAALSSHQEAAACAMLARKTADKLPDPGEDCAAALRGLRLGAGGAVTAVSVWGDEAHVTSPEFWDRSLQNWQSELLAVLSMVVLSIYLWQRGSPESKPVGAAHSSTGVEG